jgi:hypothetical protein
MPPNQIQWVLLEWAERPAKRRRARVGTSIAAKKSTRSRDKQEQEQGQEVRWRYL